MKCKISGLVVHKVLHKDVLADSGDDNATLPKCEALSRTASIHKNDF